MLVIDLICITFVRIFSRESNSTTTNVHPSVSLLPKSPNSLKSIISPYHYLHHHSHHQTLNHTTSHTTSHSTSHSTSHTTLHTTSHTTSHTASSHNITHTPSPTQPCTWATFKLFSLLLVATPNSDLKIVLDLHFLNKFFFIYDNQWQLWKPHDMQLSNLSVNIFKNI